MNVPDLSTEMTPENFRRVVDVLNTVFRNLSLDNNFSSQVIENIVLDNGVETRISHNLKTVPKYRIILRQDNVDAVITDGNEPWNDKYVTLHNHGSADTTITLLLLRR